MAGKNTFEVVAGGDKADREREPSTACQSSIARLPARIARRYLEKLAAINDSADRIVDKLPENTVYLGFIATLFPRQGDPLPP